MSDKLMELARRVEGLSGPDRDVDLEIARIFRVTVWKRNDDDTANYETTHWRYTESLDAARSLIDPADEWDITTLYNVARASVGLNRCHQVSWAGYGEHLGGDPVLAFLAAALRSRASMGEGE